MDGDVQLLNKNYYKTMNTQKNNPLHNITLKKVLEDLVEKYGWEYLGEEININCFIFDPSMNSSLKFLRQTPWARKKVENLWLKQKKYYIIIIYYFFIIIL